MEYLISLLAIVVGVILLVLILKIGSRILKLVFSIIVLCIAISLFAYVIKIGLLPWI